VVRRLGDLQAAEDAIQEAFIAAASRWPSDGVPDRPGAWLTTTAWRKAVDGRRRDHFPLAGACEREAIVRLGSSDDPKPALDVVACEDDVLSLVLTCCHPSLSPEAQVALTLRHVVGLTDRQVAACFLVPEPTLSKRLVRARAKIRDAGIAFDLPDRTRLSDRLDEVHTVVYLIFTEGYLASGPERSVQAELCDEAVWLARNVHRLLPDDRETTGLLALLLLQHARTGARTDDDGALISFAEQDRARWNTALLDEARALLASTAPTVGGPGPGPYQLEAAAALLHATAPPGGPPAWALIADLYQALARVSPSPVVEVNRAVAVGRAHGPAAGLRVLRPVLDDPRYADYLPMSAAHADLLERAGRPGAAQAWRHAAGHASNPAQREHLLRRAERCAAADRTPSSEQPDPVAHRGAPAVLCGGHPASSR
jgi:RNA polymerase sigma-70 factor (ECF subfamily)